MRAPCLQPGGTIGLCSPSHIAHREEYARIIAALERRGLRVKEADNLYSTSYGYLSSPEERAADLNQLIRDPEVDMILFGGGECGPELLPYVDWEAIRHHPKRICSYSDGTTLLASIWAKTGLETYYGQSPNMMPDMTEENWAQFCQHLMTEHTDAHRPLTPWLPQTGGTAEGILIGGYPRNIALLLAGDYFPIDMEQDYILFLEDHIQFGGVDFLSTFLSHLELTPFFRRVRGLVYGHYDTQLHPDFLARLRRLGEKHRIPAVYCDDFGHGHESHAILPIGRRARLDADNGTLTYL